MFRRHLKKAVYTAILTIPFLVFFFRPMDHKAMLAWDTSVLVPGILDAPLKEIKKIWFYRETYEAYIQLKKRNEVLKARFLALENEIEKSGRAELIEQVRRKQQFPSLVANVIGRDPTNWNAVLIINKGSLNGIKVGHPVVSELGLVGRVAEVGKRTAKVMMLADPNFAVAAVVLRTRESGLLTGSLQGLCRLQYLTDTADVKVGDQVVTSSLSTSFPEGILVGEVIEIKASAFSRSVDCLVQPAVNLAQLDDVIVIKK